MGTNYNPNAKTAPCPRCGQGTIYTQPHMREQNQTLDGKQVCVKCYSNNLIDTYLNREVR